MDGKISAYSSGQRLGRPVRLSMFLMAAVVIAAVCAGVVPAAGGAATAARGKNPKPRLCSALIPTSAIKQITG